MDLRSTFAMNLRRLRAVKGWSQEELAFEAGVNRSYLARVEAARANGPYVGLEVIGKLAEALEVDPAELLRLPSKRTRS
jgi:transcriptional regulator with XRE-family HTH domain